MNHVTYVFPCKMTKTKRDVKYNGPGLWQLVLANEHTISAIGNWFKANGNRLYTNLKE
jgi:hypothetical protein